MNFVYSMHWMQKRKIRKDITDDFLEYAITHSNQIKDKYCENAFNAVCKIQFNGKTLKVVYKKIDYNKIKIITAFWLD